MCLNEWEVDRNEKRLFKEVQNYSKSPGSCKIRDNDDPGSEDNFYNHF